MELARSYNMHGSITTNGTLFTDNIIKKLVEIELDCIIFSIDSPNAEDHNFLRSSKDAFQRAIHAIRTFNYWKSRIKKPNPSIHMNVVLCNLNYNKLDQMFQMAKELGVSNIQFIPLLINTPKSKELKLSDKQISEFQNYITQLKPIQEKYAMTTNLQYFLDSELVSKTDCTDKVILSYSENNKHKNNEFVSLPCFSPWLSLVVHSTGHVNPCIYEKPVSYIDGRRLEEIWYEDAHINNIRKNILERKLPNMCKVCCAPRIAENIELRREMERVLTKA